MKKSLAAQALGKYLAGLLLVGLMLFWPAGDIGWRNGWLFIGILFGPMIPLGIVLLLKAPDLLRKRLDAREKEGEQKAVVALSALIFLAGFVLAGLDSRFAWSEMPWGISLAAAFVQLAAYGMYAEVMRENAYLSRTISVQQGQKVVDTGLYGVVRHPMYAATVLLFLAIPVVLGSWAALAVFLAYPFVIAKRIRNEEKVLREGLDGYAAYCEKVRWRLIPFVW